MSLSSEPAKSVGHLSSAPGSSTVGAPPGRKRRSRSPGGLGRGLAGILGEQHSAVQLPPSAAGLLQLVGADPGPRIGEIRRFVLESALGAVADGFGADGLILVGGGARQPSGHNQDPDDPDGRGRDTAGNEGGLVSLSARLPSGWSAESPEIFEVYGNLWRLLDHSDATDSSGDRDRDFVCDRSVGHHQRPIGEGWLWMCRIEDRGSVLCAAAVRSERFSEAEEAALATVVGSVVGAVADCDRSVDAGGRSAGSEFVDVQLRHAGEETVAEVSAPSGASRLTATGRSSDPVEAVAFAAANACRPQCEVMFAGISEIDGGAVSVVVVRTGTGLRFGFAVTEPDDLSGPAAAVLSVGG